MLKDAWKVVVLGEARVGKTSLIARLCLDQFSDRVESTVNAAVTKKDIILSSGGAIRLNIWDTAGQEKYHAMLTSYYKNALGALIVFDLTDVTSFEIMKAWIKELNEECPGISIVIVGNKCDMIKNRHVGFTECIK